MNKVRIYFTGDYESQMKVLELLRNKNVKIHVTDGENKKAIPFTYDNCCGTSGSPFYPNEI